MNRAFESTQRGSLWTDISLPPPPPPPPSHLESSYIPTMQVNNPPVAGMRLNEWIIDRV